MEIFNLKIYELRDIPDFTFKKQWKIIRDLSFIHTDHIDSVEIIKIILNIISKENIDTTDQKIVARLSLESDDCVKDMKYMFVFDKFNNLTKVHYNKNYFKEYNYKGELK